MDDEKRGNTGIVRIDMTRWTTKTAAMLLLLMMAAFSALLFQASDAAAQTGNARKPSVETEPDAVDPALRRRAAASLYRLKRAMERDRYPSALAALNMWRSDAMAAREFDEARYRDYKRRILEKSVANIVKWFEVCLQENWIREARYCRKIYRLHGRAIDAFDPARYEEMAERIEQRKKEIEAEKQRHQTTSSNPKRDSG